MRKLFITTAAFALLAPAAIALDDPRDVDQAQTATQQTLAQTVTEQEWTRDDQAAYTQLAVSDISVRDLLGEPIHGVNGDRIARVDDIHFDEQGSAQSLVFLSGGFLGIGAKRGSLDFDRVSISVEQDRDPRVEVSMTEDALEAAPDFRTDDRTRLELASNIIGSSARLEGSDEQARIHDVILTRDGTAQYLILTDGMAGRLAGERRAVKFDKLSRDAAADELRLDITPAKLRQTAQFEYRRVGAAPRN